MSAVVSRALVSRLQCKQAALDAQIWRLVCEAPERRVDRITFNSNVTLLGKGSREPEHMAGDRLTNWQELTNHHIKGYSGCTPFVSFSCKNHYPFYPF